MHRLGCRVADLGRSRVRGARLRRGTLRLPVAVGGGGAMSTTSSRARRERSRESRRLALRLAEAKKHNWHRTLILGAGASRAAGLPNFEELAEDLIKAVGIPRHVDGPVVSVKRYYAQPGKHPLLDIPAVLKPMKSVKPTIGYLHLAQLLEDEVFDLVLSTNWDQLVEVALADMAPTHRCQVLIREQVHESIITGYLQRPPAPLPPIGPSSCSGPGRRPRPP